MDAKTLEALEGSIAKWEKNSRVRKCANIKTEAGDCPLCKLFNSGKLQASSDCFGCPVRAKTGAAYCYNTPYWEAVAREESWNDDEIDGRAFRAAAREEVAFLKSLLPEADQ